MQNTFDEEVEDFKREKQSLWLSGRKILIEATLLGCSPTCLMVRIESCSNEHWYLLQGYGDVAVFCAMVKDIRLLHATFT